MFRIGEFSRLSRVSVRMLRHYDKLGLLQPAKVDPQSGYRFYSADQLPRANRITTLRDLGFLIDDIKRLVSLDDAALASKLTERETELLAQIDDENRRLAALQNLRDSLSTGSGEFDFEVSIKAVPAYDVVSLRMVIPSYDDERLAWEALGSYVKKHGIAVADPYREFCEFHGDDRDGVGVGIEIAVAVDEFGEDQGPIRFYRTEAFEEVASIMVYGPYDNIAPVYASFARWLFEHPLYRMAGNTREIAHRGCWNTEDPRDYLTEFQIPVARRR